MNTSLIRLIVFLKNKIAWLYLQKKINVSPRNNKTHA